MSQEIDCLFIGHNQVEFEHYERVTRQMGTESGAYRDLRLNFIYYNGKPYTMPGIFNLLNRGNQSGSKPFYLGETFSPAIAYLGSYLDRQGLRFDYVNSFREEKALLAAKLEQEKILAVAIITTLYVSPLPIVEIIDFVRAHNRTAKIILGGPFVSTQVRIQDRDSLDYLLGVTLGADIYVNSAQGEATLVKILRALKTHSPLEGIENLYYKDEENHLCRSAAAVKEMNLLTENPVNWELFQQGPGRFVNLRTAISCPFSCAFCGFPQHAGDYQTLPVEMIQKELDALTAAASPQSIHFIDDTFNVPVKRFKEILRLFVRKAYPFKWHSYFRCQYIDREMVELMKEAGCEGVFLGIESGSDAILKNMNKGTTAQKYLKGIELLKEYGITTFGSFIVGFPGETPATVRETTAFIKASGLDFYRAQLWYCEPITPIWQEREKYRLEGENFEWRHATMDSKQACDLIDEIFLTTASPLWIPQYDFDFDSIWHLTRRDMELDHIKDFLGAFKRGIIGKLESHLPKEADAEVIQALTGACPGKSGLDAVPPGEKELIEKYGAGFDY